MILCFKGVLTLALKGFTAVYIAKFYIFINSDKMSIKYDYYHQNDLTGVLKIFLVVLKTKMNQHQNVGNR
jgi:hypothetical protein